MLCEINWPYVSGCMRDLKVMRNQLKCWSIKFLIIKWKGGKIHKIIILKRWQGGHNKIICQPQSTDKSGNIHFWITVRQISEESPRVFMTYEQNSLLLYKTMWRKNGTNFSRTEQHCQKSLAYPIVLSCHCAYFDLRMAWLVAAMCLNSWDLQKKNPLFQLHWDVLTLTQRDYKDASFYTM